jgi:anthranilate synthase component 2
MTDRRRDPGMHVLVVDNYDSFAYNLVQYVGEVVTTDAYLPELMDGAVTVRRNDEITLEGIEAMAPDAIVVSPGPGTPEEAGLSMPIFASLSATPVLGVCLGHQALCAANSARVTHADSVVHGKPSLVEHDGRGVFAGLDDPIEVGRYHSLAVERDALPGALTETAWTDDEERVVMGVRHDDAPHVGLQFHPESILTEAGQNLIAAFLDTYV